MFYAILITLAAPTVPCPDWNLSWLIAEDLSFLKIFEKVEKEVIAHFWKRHPDLSGPNSVRKSVFAFVAA